MQSTTENAYNSFMAAEEAPEKAVQRSRTVLFLRLANFVLMAMGWVEALYAYPRLPRQIPLWLNFFGHEMPRAGKSPLFFLYPVAQTVCVLAIMLLFGGNRPKTSSAENAKSSRPDEARPRPQNLKTEHTLLSLIFVNLIFIHLQTSLILLAHRLSSGVNIVYFASLFMVILALIPYYRLREKLILQRRP